MMKILFWAFAALSIIAGLLISFTSLVAPGLGLVWTKFGEIVCYAGVASVGVAIIGVILGIFTLRKGRLKRAMVFVLLGAIYSGIIYVGMLADDVLATVKRDQDFDQYMEELYGQGWDSPSAIKGIPELYENVLNQFYATVRDQWSAEELMDLGAVSMPEYYGDSSLDNIGFALMDLNGDDIDEMVIGSTEGEATVIFCIYTNPDCPYNHVNSLEGETYYLHSGETDGTYEVEFVGQDFAWVIEPAAADGIFVYTDREGAMDPAGRLKLEMIPFSQYK